MLSIIALVVPLISVAIAEPPRLSPEPQFIQMSKKWPVTVDELARGFRGRPFGELVMHHVNNQSPSKIIDGVRETVGLLPPKLQTATTEWIDINNRYVTSAEFWRTDSAEILYSIVERGRRFSAQHGIAADNDVLLNLFQIVVLNFAYTANKEPKAKEFIQKSLKTAATDIPSDLKRISSVLGAPREMTVQGLMDKSKDVAEEELYDLIERDQALKKIMAKHGATRSTLKEIYWALMRAGAGQWESGHWVAASALAFEASLDFVLTSTNKATKLDRNTLETTAYKLIIYFENGAAGPIR